MNFLLAIEGAAVMSEAKITDDDMIHTPDINKEFNYLLITDSQSENEDFLVAFAGKTAGGPFYVAISFVINGETMNLQKLEKIFMDDYLHSTKMIEELRRWRAENEIV